MNRQSIWRTSHQIISKLKTVNTTHTTFGDECHKRSCLRLWPYRIPTLQRSLRCKRQFSDVGLHILDCTSPALPCNPFINTTLGVSATPPLAYLPPPLSSNLELLLWSRSASAGSTCDIEDPAGRRFHAIRPLQDGRHPLGLDIAWVARRFELA